MAVERSVLLVTGRAALAEAVAAVGAALGVTIDVRADVDSAGPVWPASGLVLLGDDVAARGVPSRRAAVVVVAPSGAPDRLWRTALEIGAEHVAVLPEDHEWLLHRLDRHADPGSATGLVVGVVGGCGGAGATTLSACLAVTAAARRSTALVDADPWGAGVDAILGSHDEPGLRWADLQGLRGPVRSAALCGALPHVRGASVLSWGCGPAAEPHPEAVESVLEAARRHFGLVVVDLPRAPSPSATAALAAVDVVLLLVPAQVRATLAAARVLSALRPVAGDVRLVVRGPSPGGLAAEQVAAALDLPLQGRLAPERRLGAALERGLLPPARGPLRTFCRELAAIMEDPPPLIGAGTPTAQRAAS